MLLSLPPSGYFEPVTTFEDAFSILTLIPEVEMTEAKATIAAAQMRLEVAQHQKEELELNLAELTKRWDSQVAELQVETEHLSIIRSQTIPIDPRALSERAQKGAHEVRDARVAECVAQ
ncbi:uncharacterized protein A4U43_C03F24450 [Asparagus officinalis]|uniref:Uncharacterized protein n=1 Tax=Asparagus officinalis TaxID=4686 RepID=A0A5P1FCQ4_ASPOF|nr:uncharacterized protein A4U43_C03F24450 [Asparagus officinalis]